MTSSASPLLDVQDLHVGYGSTAVLKGLSFSLAAGRSLAVIGESGSGKSTLAKAVMGILPTKGQVRSGTVYFDGVDLVHMPETRRRLLRGTGIGYVPQDPRNALNPVRTVGAQGHEAAALVEKDRRRQKDLLLQAFAQAGLARPEDVYAAYPHQLSGGMLQRALIALCIVARPRLIIADEPTSALDATIQKTILDLIIQLQQDLGLGLMLITHDLAIASSRAQDVLVLKDGLVQEYGPARLVLSQPQSAYTRALRNNVPSLNPDRYAQIRSNRHVSQGHLDIEVRSLGKSYGGRDTVSKALCDVSFVVERGRTHALVGESGAGKTTVSRILMGLEQPDSGEIRIQGVSLTGASVEARRELRRHLQLVYQNPFASLDPMWRVEAIVREPLDNYRLGTPAERRSLVRSTLQAVGLDETLLRRRPSMLSGGQRQRVAIARALVLRPQILVLDEPTSALDVNVQADILQLLVSLQQAHGLTYLVISHDLPLMRQFADTLTVLRRGEVVEDGTVREVFASPRQAYTRSLLDAIPNPSPGVESLETPVAMPLAA